MKCIYVFRKKNAMQTNMITLGIYGISPMWESWLQTELNKSDDFKILFIHHDEQSLIEDVQIKKPDILFLMLKYPYPEKFILQIQKSNAGAKLTGWWFGPQMDDRRVFQMLKTGIHCILSDRHGPDEIRRAIRDTYENGYHYNDIVTDAIMQYGKRANQVPASFGPPVNFREREIEMIELRKSGLTTREIGERLYLSKKTVENVFNNLYRKFECRNFMELLVHYEKGNYTAC